MRNVLVMAAVWLIPLVAVFALDAPQVSITAACDGDTTCVRLDWISVAGAVSYQVRGRTQWTGPDSLLAWTDTTSCQFALPTGWDSLFQPSRFGSFNVVAIGELGDMVFVPAGSFTMGQAGVATPEHTVHLTYDFYLDAHEVTNQQYMEALQWALGQDLVTADSSSVQAYGVELLNLDATNYCEIAFNTSTQQFYLVARSYNSGSWGPGFAYPGGYDPADHPVKEVSWYGAACYCDWRSLREGLPAFYQGNWDQSASHDPYLAQGYRLPTEAEWEYAAQWDDERSYPWGNESPTCALLNYHDGGSYCIGWTSPVGNYPLTGRGFSDLAGNIREWCGDGYGSYSSSNQTNPYGIAGSPSRVIRGGCWTGDDTNVQCAHRRNSDPLYASSGVGFRAARTVNP